MLTRTIHTPVWLGSGQTSWQMGFDEPRAQIIFRAVTIPPTIISLAKAIWIAIRGLCPLFFILCK